MTKSQLSKKNSTAAEQNKINSNKLLKGKLNPIVIYQMGKVGSSTVYKSLLNSKANQGNIFHVHRLHSEINPNNSKNIFLRELYDNASVNNKWKVISLVRDPIARNMSAFFQNIERFVPNFYEEYKGHNSDFRKLNDIFFKRYPHHIPQNYFDLEIKTMFDIDIFSQSFDTNIGYQIYSSSLADLLVMRLDKLSEKIVGKFLNIKDFKLENHNVGDEKKYNDIYKLFKQKFRPADDYIDEMYSQKYTKYFYTKEEIKELTEKYK